MLLRIDFSVRSQSGIRHRATISRQTIRLSRESTIHPPPLTFIVFLLLCTVFLAYPFCQRARKYNASDRINRSLSCRVHCYQNGKTGFLVIFAECAKKHCKRIIEGYCNLLLLDIFMKLINIITELIYIMLCFYYFNNFLIFNIIVTDSLTKKKSICFY